MKIGSRETCTEHYPASTQHWALEISKQRRTNRLSWTKTAIMHSLTCYGGMFELCCDNTGPNFNRWYLNKDVILGWGFVVSHAAGSAEVMMATDGNEWSVFHCDKSTVEGFWGIWRYPAVYVWTRFHSLAKISQWNVVRHFSVAETRK